MSIEDSPQKAMPVKDIYNWIQEHFPFYQTAPIGWKNSVRHNLSLNQCFRKVEKSPVSAVNGILPSSELPPSQLFTQIFSFCSDFALRSDFSERMVKFYLSHANETH